MRCCRRGPRNERQREGNGRILSSAIYLGVGDRWQRVVDAGRLSGHCQQCGDTERDAGRNGVSVQPEGNPRHDDQHAARDVDGQQVIRELSLEQQVHSQAGIFTWRVRKLKRKEKKKKGNH